MVKLKVLKFCGYEMSDACYVVDFYRIDGVTKAITICDNGKISEYDINDIEIDLKDAIK